MYFFSKNTKTDKTTVYLQIRKKRCGNIYKRINVFDPILKNSVIYSRGGHYSKDIFLRKLNIRNNIIYTLLKTV